MNDSYREIMVKPDTPAGKKFLKGMFPVMAGFCFLAGMILWPFWLLAVIFVVLAIFVGSKMEVEYEYLYVNGELDIDAIYSKQKRKRVGTFDMEQLEVLAPQNSHALDSFLSRKDSKYRDFSSKKAPQSTYVLVFNQEKGQQIIAVELDEMILKDIRRIAPRKVNLY